MTLIGNSESGDPVLFLVIEDAYKSPTVNGQKYIHTVEAITKSAAIRRVADAIRGRLDGEGRKLLDDGIVLSVIDWADVTTLRAQDDLSVGPT